MLGDYSMTSAAEPASTLHARPGGIAPFADKLLTKACQALSSADAFSFHAEIMFDQVLSPDRVADMHDLTIPLSDLAASDS